MKIKTISRTEESFCRSTSKDIVKVHRNRDPALHPFDKAREYTKALVATKAASAGLNLTERMESAPHLYE